MPSNNDKHQIRLCITTNIYDKSTKSSILKVVSRQKPVAGIRVRQITFPKTNPIYRNPSAQSSIIAGCWLEERCYHVYCMNPYLVLRVTRGQEWTCLLSRLSPSPSRNWLIGWGVSLGWLCCIGQLLHCASGRLVPLHVEGEVVRPGGQG